MRCLRAIFFCAVFLLAAAGLTGCVHPVASTWLTSVPDAMTQARQESRLVLLYFTGSDWCEWCIQLKQDVFNKRKFSDYANKNLVLVEVDFPIQKKQEPALEQANDALKEKYSVTNYPTLIALKPDGAVVWKLQGYLDAKDMIAQLNQAKKK